MATVVLTLAALRQGVASRVATLHTTSTPWREAGVPYDRFGAELVPDYVPATVAHLAYAVGVPSTPDIGDRQKPTDGALVKTALGVRFLAQHKALASLQSADAALDHEQDLIACLMESSSVWPGTLGVQLLLTSRAQACPPPYDWFVHTLTFQALHRLPLQ